MQKSDPMRERAHIEAARRRATEQLLAKPTAGAPARPKLVVREQPGPKQKPLVR